MRLYIQLTQLLESVPLYIRYKEEKHLENIFLKTNPENLAISASIMHCVMTSIQCVYSLTYNFSKLNKETEKTIRVIDSESGCEQTTYFVRQRDSFCLCFRLCDLCDFD